MCKKKKKKKEMSGSNIYPEASPIYSLGLHQLGAVHVLVALVRSANTGAVDAPALLRPVALLGLERAVILAFRVVDPIVVHEGVLVWLPEDAASDALALSGPVHLSLHQKALWNHWRRKLKTVRT